MADIDDDILHTLRAEHDVLRQMQDLVRATSGAIGTRAQLWFRLKSELYAHAKAEEEAVYQRLARVDSTAELAEHSIEEHEAIEELLDQLDHLGFDQPSWMTTLDRLIEMSDHHLDEEEEELFPWAGRVLTVEERREASAEYRRLKQKHLADAFDQLTRTTHHGRDGRTYESRSLGSLVALAKSKGIATSDLSRSEIVSALRGAPGTDA